jgi:hypothetical protein
MSTEYKYTLAAGFKITGAELYEAFGILVPEVSRMEDRYHPKTGRKSRKKIIITPKHRRLEFNGKRIREDVSECLSDEEVLVTKIAEKVDCYYYRYGNAQTDVYSYVFGPFETTQVQHLEEHSSITLLSIEKVNFARIGRALRGLGLKVHQPEVFLCKNIY